MNISLAKYSLIQNIIINKTIMSAFSLTFNEVLIEIRIRKCNSLKTGEYISLHMEMNFPF